MGDGRSAISAIGLLADARCRCSLHGACPSGLWLVIGYRLSVPCSRSLDTRKRSADYLRVPHQISLISPWPRQNVTNPHTNAKLPEVTLRRGAPMRPIFHCKIHDSRPWRAQNHAPPLENVRLGHMASPWADSGGPNPSVILTTFIHVLRQNDTNC